MKSKRQEATEVTHFLHVVHLIWY